MMSRCVFLLVVVLTAVAGSYVLAQDNDAAACYVEGDRQWMAGNVDGAITQWTQALKLKPGSSLTKDRLIEALQKKVVLLTQQLVEAQSRTKETVIRIAGSPAGTPAAPATNVAAKTGRVDMSRFMILKEQQIVVGLAGRMHLQGTATNTSTESLSYVSVKFRQYDKSGVQLRSAFTNNTDLAPGQWKFDIFLDDNTAKVEFIGFEADSQRR